MAGDLASKTIRRVFALTVMDGRKTKKIKPGNRVLTTSLLPMLPSIAIAFGAGWLAVAAAAHEYSVGGRFKIESGRKFGTRPAEVDGWFTVMVKECEWTIRSKRTDLESDYEEDGYDGEHVYSLTSMETWVRKRIEKGVRVGANTGEGVVTPGPVPYNSPEVNRILWLAFASGCYLGENSTGRLPALATLSSRHAYLYGEEQISQWRTVDPPGLPAFAVLFSDGRVRRWNDEDAGFMTGPPIESTWPPPYDGGFTNAALIVDSFHTESGYSIPKTATFRILAPKANGGSTNELDLLRTYSIGLTNALLKVERTDFRPKINGVVYVTDKRFERERKPIHQISYTFDKQWLSDDEVRRRPEFPKATALQQVQINASLSAANVQQVRSQRGKQVVWVLAIASTLGLAWIFISVRKQQTSATVKN